MIPGSANPLLLKSAAAAGGYQVSRSLRFSSSDSAYCLRTPSSNGTSYTTWTWSMWVKRSLASSGQVLFSSGTNTDDYLIVVFDPNDTLVFLTGENGATNQNLINTTAVFRDYSAWYHFVIQADFTNATQADRIKIYVNNVRQTVSGPIAAQNYSGTTFNRSGIAHNIGRQGNGVSYLSGYLADIHFIDGQALTPSSFTEVSATTGQLIPKTYSGSFGTNGFWLKFSDNSNNTAATLGKDYSPNGNNWTPNNLSVTAGAGNDSLVDTPTSYGTPDTGVGNEVRGNYATLNPLGNSVSAAPYAPSNGNLQLTNPSGTSGGTVGTFEISSGKWYFEYTLTSMSSTGPFFGIAEDDRNLALDPGLNQSNVYGVYINPWLNANSDGTQIWSAYYGDFGGITASDGDIFQIAIDATNLSNVKMWLGRNNTYFGASNNVYGNPSAGTNNTFTITSGQKLFPYLAIRGPGATGTLNANFGQRAFSYTAPTNFKALCDTNLPAPVVAKPNTVMDVVTYNGSSGTKTITMPGGFSPDLVWIKNRGQTRWHSVFDQVRGVYKRLFTNTTNAETNDVGYNLDSFTSTGFTLLDTDRDTNSSSGDAYVAWCWDAGTSTVSNTAGSITSQVRANVSAGFSVVTYTGNGANATVGHGLGVAPSLIIVKQRSTASSNGNWAVQHQSLGATKNLILNSTAAADGPDAGYWNSTSPTSSVFSVGTYEVTNRSTATYVAYCWAPLVGYASFGSYVGNGSSDGPFIFTGFRPKLLLIKSSTAVRYWVLYDTSRSNYNAATARLYADISSGETTSSSIDILSNGFKIRSGSGSGFEEINESGATLIYAAWAENPFQYARAR